ncbi:MAG: IS110 family transposase [Actinomycetota bacterium]
MSSVTYPEVSGKIIVGVDTHKHVHVAVAIDQLGVRLDDLVVPVDTGGYRQLVEWAREWGEVDAFGVEGTGSYGAGLASYLRRQGLRVVEVNRGDRRARRANGKSDTLDAEAAGRAVLNGTATATPKAADGAAEMIRQIKVARDTAVKARTSAIITLKALVVNAPADLRESLDGLADKTVIDRCAGFRPGEITDPTASAKHALRATARRWLDLSAEIGSHDTILDDLTEQTAPTLREGFGIGADTAAEMLIIFGDNPDRIRSEAAFAKLCGACPVPASSGMTNRHRLYWGGHRQANAAIYRTVIVRMRHHQPTIDYVKRRTAEGLTKRDIIRCLKRFVAREIYQRVMTDHRSRQQAAA